MKGNVEPNAEGNSDEDPESDYSARILLIAPVQSAGASKTNIVGGNRVMADEQTRELKRHGFIVDTIDTSGSVTNLHDWKITAHRLLRLVRVLWQTSWRAHRADILCSIMASYSAQTFGLALWVISRTNRKPLVLRFSGAGYAVVYSNYNRLQRWIADRTYMRSALIFLETEELVKSFSTWPNFRWFPNTREMVLDEIPKRECAKRLIFVSRLAKNKGLTEALEACQNLPDDCHLFVYGAPTSQTDMSKFDGHPRASYCGVVAPSDVPMILSNHDLMLFPSYEDYEGYPGVILEAFQCGIPVIAAKWYGVEELVEHKVSGLLVEPRSVDELESAIRLLLEDSELYQQLSEGAQQRGDCFRSTEWYGTFADNLHQSILENRTWTSLLSRKRSG